MSYIFVWIFEVQNMIIILVDSNYNYGFDVIDYHVNLNCEKKKRVSLNLNLDEHVSLEEYFFWVRVDNGEHTFSFHTTQKIFFVLCTYHFTLIYCRFKR